MHIYAKLGIVVGLMTAIGVVVILKQGGTKPCCPGHLPAVSHPLPTDADAAEPAAPLTAALPRLVELGSTTCVPCKMMKPILDELSAAYAGKLEVSFIDIKQQTEQADRYSIRVIPTQVFLAPDGSELFRHEGFFPKEDILAKWKELGYEF